MRMLLPSFLAFTLIGCATPETPAESPQATQDAESARLTAYLDADYEKELAMNPERLTNLGRKEQYDKLDDRSEAADDRKLEWRRKSVADMKTAFDSWLREMQALQDCFGDAA